MWCYYWTAKTRKLSIWCHPAHLGHKLCSTRTKYISSVNWNSIAEARYQECLMIPPTRCYPWWRHQIENFLRYWPFVRGIHRSPVDSPHKGQWRGALMFSLICAWTNGWASNKDAGYLRRHRAHYDVPVMRTEYLKYMYMFLKCYQWMAIFEWMLTYN